MKLLNYLYRFLLALALFTGVIMDVSAQVPECGKIYNVGINGLTEYDPTQPISATNPSPVNIPLPPNWQTSNGLAVSDNFNGQGPSPTFYTVIGGQYVYWNGSVWVNTGHHTTSPNPASYYSNAGALGAGGGFIYGYNNGGGYGNCGWGWITRYNGEGDAVLVPISGNINQGLSALAVDCQGNFYIYFAFASSTCYASLASNWNRLVKFDPGGNMLQSWLVVNYSGYPNLWPTWGGMTIVGDTVYGELGKAYLDANSPTINFFGSGLNLGQVMTACPIGAMQTGLGASIDTAFLCNRKDTITVDAAGTNGPVSAIFSTIGGGGNISGSGISRSVTTDSFVQVSVRSVCFGSDTFTVIAPPKIDAGPDRTITGCNGLYNDTLKATVDGPIDELDYKFAWTPSVTIVHGDLSKSPVIQPDFNTDYILSVSIGSCTWFDSVSVAVADSTVSAEFTSDFHYGCGVADTVQFFDHSTGAHYYSWAFGDGQTSGWRDPFHTYQSQDIFSVTLVAGNTLCHDTIIKLVDLKSDRINPFSLGEDQNFCKGTPINLTLSTNVPLGAEAAWSDGSLGASLSVSAPGTYWVSVTKSPCTFSDTLTVTTELCDCIINFPTAFSPNQDGHNDIFRPVVEPGCPLRGWLLQIFNRWGEKVFESYDSKTGWDGFYKGESADIGTYMYSVQYEAGTKGNVYHRTGDVVLIR